MTTRELIGLLQQHPPEMRVVVSGYEGGVDDVGGMEEVPIKLDQNTARWYFGAHEVCGDDEEPDETALSIW